MKDISEEYARAKRSLEVRIRREKGLIGRSPTSSGSDKDTLGALEEKYQRLLKYGYV